MVSLKSFATLLAFVAATAVQAVTIADLPIFFFHGLTGNITDSTHIAANLTAEGRTFTPLTFCSDSCSGEAINTQIPLALEQLRGIIANDTATYENGYIVLAHSQGAVIARAVIENWDEHNVQLFVSMAGSQNGIFFGPQASDTIPLNTFVTYFAPAVIPSDVFNVSAYTKADWRGKLQYDLNEVFATDPDLMDELAYANRWRSPDQDSWVEWNTVFPELNNVNNCADTDCEEAKVTRRDNFLRIQQSHFLISPRDGAVSPYQSAHFGQYNYLTNASQILTEFESLEIIAMEDTIEYQNDTYGLQTLHTAGRLHLHELADVVHGCWLRDSYFLDNSTELCSFGDVFGANIYPLLFSSDEVEASGSSSSAPDSTTSSGSSAAGSNGGAICSDHV